MKPRNCIHGSNRHSLHASCAKGRQFNSSRRALHLGKCLSIIATKRSSWCFASRCTSSCITTYSRLSADFFASSRLIQIRRASTVHVPHLVFILLIPNADTSTPSRFCHL